MKKASLKLDDLKVKSFVTKEKSNLKGGCPNGTTILFTNCGNKNCAA